MKFIEERTYYTERVAFEANGARWEQEYQGGHNYVLGNLRTSIDGACTVTLVNGERHTRELYFYGSTFEDCLDELRKLRDNINAALGEEVAK